MLKKFFSLYALSLGLFLPRGFASHLTSNSDLTIDPGGPGFVGTEVADTGILKFGSASSDVSGTLEQQVYQETEGTLDFYYLLTNNSTSRESIVRITSTNFTSFNVAVAYLPIAGGIPPTEADRSSAGDTVAFDVTLPPGTASDWLEISTNAKLFALTGVTNVIDTDGGTVATLTTYSPAIATPEPMSVGLLALGLLSVTSLRRMAKIPLQ